jgi:hypothetical protein
VIIVLAAQMTGATLSTVTHSTHTLDASESVRATTMMLRDELAGVVVNERPDRYLNLRVVEDDERLALYFTVPRAQTSDLTRMGFVSHVIYVWDKASRTLGRAEYHSSREPDAVVATGGMPDGTNAEANLRRLRKLTPSYQGTEPYEWTTVPLWDERLKEARRNPLLRDISEWKIECFESIKLDEDKPVENTWEHSDRLPAVIRFSFVFTPQRRATAEKEVIGRRYLSIIPLPSAEVRK